MEHEDVSNPRKSPYDALNVQLPPCMHKVVLAIQDHDVPEDFLLNILTTYCHVDDLTAEHLCGKLMEYGEGNAIVAGVFTKDIAETICHEIVQLCEIKHYEVYSVNLPDEGNFWIPPGKIRENGK